MEIIPDVIANFAQQIREIHEPELLLLNMPLSDGFFLLFMVFISF